MEPKSSPPSADQINSDRLSTLPPEIAHHILSFLPIIDLTRVGVLSKRCRRFYLSTPKLNITKYPSEWTESWDKRSLLLTSLSKFFRLRGDNRVQTLELDWVSQFNDWDTDINARFFIEKCALFTWFRNAILKFKVEKMEFTCDDNLPILSKIICGHYVEDEIFGHYIEDETQLELPLSMIADGSLRSLYLDVGFFFLKAPKFSTCSVSNLVFLRLRSLTMENGEKFCKWVSLYCKFLEELRLECVKGLRKIDIKSSCLKSFGVESLSSHDLLHLKLCCENLGRIYMNWSFEDAKCTKTNSIEISAPNLKCLKWLGDFMSHQDFGEFNCLEEVQLSLNCDGVDDFCGKLNQFLISIQCVKVLTIDAQTAKTLFKKGYTPPPLPNLWCLHMIIWSGIEDDLVQAMTSLFKGIPNLSTLDMVISDEVPLYFLYFRTATDANSSGFDGGYWELQSPSFISHLKEVTIELTNGSNGFDFARYILEHALNLKTMVVFYLPNQVSFKRELRKSKKVSNALVTFVKKECRADYLPASARF